MFYGTINSDGTIDTSSAFSNNFSVDNPSTGVYTITFNEYLNYAPSIVATGYSNATGNSAVTVEYTMTQTDPTGPLVAQFITTDLSYNQNNFTFSFHARPGLSLAFDASHNQILSLVPEIISFGTKKIPVLTLSTSISGLGSSGQPGSGEYTAFLDKGTDLLGVLEGGGTMTLSIPNTVEDDSRTTWNLTGWTFGGGAGATGKEWAVGKETSTYALGVSTSGGSPMTTPETFVIMATDGTQTLTTDPLVRLSRVPPAGLSM